MRNKLRVLCVVISMITAMTTVLPAHAMIDNNAAGAEISTRNTNINSSSISLSFNGSKANCSASVIGYSANTTYVKIVMTLYKYSGGKWTSVQSWSDSANGTYVSLSKSATVSSGKYKLTCVYTANSEVITKSTEKTK